MGGFSVRPQGLTLGVRSNQHWMLERIRREILLPSWTVEEYNFDTLFSVFVGGEKRPGFRNFSLLYDNTTRLGRSHDVEELYQMFEQAFHQRVASTAHQLFVRGVTLGFQGEATLLLNAEPAWLAGQSEPLRQRGAELLSPEFAVLDADGMAYPYPNRPAGELGLNLAEQPMPLRRVVVEGGARDLSSAEVAWHLFGRLQKAFAAGGAVAQLSRAVRIQETRGQAVESFLEAVC